VALPEGWKPSSDLLEWAEDRFRGSPVDAALETEKFVNYARSTDWRKVDWNATWRNWMLKAESIALERRQGEPQVHYEQL
jgi:hypothetical protein